MNERWFVCKLRHDCFLSESRLIDCLKTTLFFLRDYGCIIFTHLHSFICHIFNLVNCVVVVSHKALPILWIFFRLSVTLRLVPKVIAVVGLWSLLTISSMLNNLFLITVGKKHSFLHVFTCCCIYQLCWHSNQQSIWNAKDMCIQHLYKESFYSFWQRQTFWVSRSFKCLRVAVPSHKRIITTLLALCSWGALTRDWYTSLSSNSLLSFWFVIVNRFAFSWL